MSGVDTWTRALLALARRIVPAVERESWHAEWLGEISALMRRAAGWPGSARRLARQAARVALCDAVWLRLHPRRSRSRRPYRHTLLELQPPIDAGGGRLAAAGRDLRFACRRLRRAPGFALAAISLLGLSLAATIAVFALVRSIVIAPLAYADADRLVRILAFDPGEQQEDWLSMAEVDSLRETSESLAAVAYSTLFSAVVARDDGPMRVQRAAVSEDYFRTLGASAHRGRLLTAGREDEASVVLGYDFWRRHWQGDEAVVGRQMVIDDQTYSVVGIASPAIATHDLGAERTDMWLLWPRSRSARNVDTRIYTVIARLAAGTDIEVARTEILARQARLAAARPDLYGGWQLAIAPLKDTVIGASRQPLMLLLAALGLLLFAVAANLANVMLVRLAGRRGELAIHIALGGRRRALARQLLIESAILATAGGTLGWLLAQRIVGALPGWLPFALPRQAEITLGWPSALFTAAAAAGAALVFGWLPVRLGRGGELISALRADGRGVIGQVGWLRRGLIIVQVAVAMPLLIAASLLVGSMLDLGAADLGMRPADVSSARVSVPFGPYAAQGRRAAFFAELLASLEARPEVASAGAAVQVPLLTHELDRTRYTVAGEPAASEHEQPRALLQVVTPGYFATLETRLVAGRDFDAHDRAAGTPVAIVNQALAARHFAAGATPAQAALGRAISLELILDGEAATRTLVGVVEDVAQVGPDVGVEPTIFLPHGQVSWPAMGVVVRAASAEAQLAEAIRAEALRLEPQAVVDPVVALSDALARRLGPSRSAAWLIAWFAVVATGLSMLGLYALLSYDAAQSVREMAIRMAVGATAGAIRRRLLLRAVALVSAGALLGLGAAWLAARFLRQAVHGVTGIDAWSLAVALCGLLLVAVLGSWLPAARAARTSPTEALRQG